jgi:hypothetical protein
LSTIRNDVDVLSEASLVRHSVATAEVNEIPERNPSRR